VNAKDDTDVDRWLRVRRRVRALIDALPDIVCWLLLLLAIWLLTR
jgi:hypothetical protein